MFREVHSTPQTIMTDVYMREKQGGVLGNKEQEETNKLYAAEKLASPAITTPAVAPPTADSNITNTASGMSLICLSDEEGPRQPPSPKVEALHFNKLQAKSFNEELKFFRLEIDQGRTSGAHFTDPGASLCYRCPVCRETNFWVSPPVSLRTHFGEIHSDSASGYRIIIGGKTGTQFTIASTERGLDGEGATPPSVEFVMLCCPVIPTTVTQEPMKKNQKTALREGYSKPIENLPEESQQEHTKASKQNRSGRKTAFAYKNKKSAKNGKPTATARKRNREIRKKSNIDALRRENGCRRRIEHTGQHHQQAKRDTES